MQFIITNDAQASSNAVIKGDLQGAGYTVNRYAFLQSKFDGAGVKVIMPYISNFSNGGDGIIAKSSIQGIKDLAGKKMAIPRFSEAQTLVEWLVRNSDDITDAERQQIRDSAIYFEDPEDCAKAYFSGQVDAAATWEPFLTQAKNTAGSRVLFDTSMATNLILDGIIFRQDFADSNASFIINFIDGALQAAAMYKTDFSYIRQMPMFEFLTDQEILDMVNIADLANWRDNKKLLSGDAAEVYRDMAQIWSDIGEVATPAKADSAFSDRYLMNLEDKYNSIVSGIDDPQTEIFTPENKEIVLAQDNNDALLSKTLKVEFETGRAVILPESYFELNEFARIAKILDRTYIQVEGNTDSNGSYDMNIKLSEERARSVVLYLQAQGIEASRFIIVGHGPNNPIADNTTDEGRAKNRRTDAYFKVIQ
jgi:outer membrane protein OmpA-like peptidoglycan-associated protein